MKNDCVNSRVSILSVCCFCFFFFFFIGYTMLQFIYKWSRRAKARIILKKYIYQAYRGHFHSRTEVLSYVDKTVRKASAYCFICVHADDKSTN